MHNTRRIYICFRVDSSQIYKVMFSTYLEDSSLSHTVGMLDEVARRRRREPVIVVTASPSPLPPAVSLSQYI